MLDFVTSCFFWVLALYGLIEIIKNIFYIHSCSRIHADGINMIVAVKNQENTIEGFLRSLNFRTLYGKENYIENILLLDLNSNDNTKIIIENFSLDHPNMRVINWSEFEKLFSPERN